MARMSSANIFSVGYGTDLEYLAVSQNFFQSEHLLISLIYSKLNGICRQNASSLTHMQYFP